MIIAFHCSFCFSWWSQDAEGVSFPGSQAWLVKSRIVHGHKSLSTRRRVGSVKVVQKYYTDFIPLPLSFLHLFAPYLFHSFLFPCFSSLTLESLPASILKFFQKKHSERERVRESELSPIMVHFTNCCHGQPRADWSQEPETQCQSLPNWQGPNSWSHHHCLEGCTKAGSWNVYKDGAWAQAQWNGEIQSCSLNFSAEWPPFDLSWILAHNRKESWVVVGYCNKYILSYPSDAWFLTNHFAGLLTPSRLNQQK